MPDAPSNAMSEDSGLIARLRAEVSALRELLAVNEATAITQSRHAAAAQAEERRVAAVNDAQRELVRDLIESSRDSVLVLDSDYMILFANGHARRGTPGGEGFIGRHILSVFPLLEATSFWSRYQQVMHTRTPVSFEDFFPRADAWFSVSVTPVALGIAVFYRDITERRIRDQALVRTEKLAAVGRMASSISHEINNPLESVTNLLYLIENTDDSLSEMRTYAQLAATELARVSHIVTQTLKFHRQSTQAVETSLSEMVESVLSLFHNRILSLRVSVHSRFSMPDTLNCFAGDVRQVMANFIGNALDAIGYDGTLWVRTRPATCPVRGVAGVRVTIADNGAGISESARAKIFEAFFTTKGLTGSGLGLWVSDEIVRAHHGTIRLRSCQTPGRSGTVFTLFFPA